MSVVVGGPVSTLHREPMSFEKWEALPEKPKAEWVDGEAV